MFPPESAILKFAALRDSFARLLEEQRNCLFEGGGVQQRISIVSLRRLSTLLRAERNHAGSQSIKPRNAPGRVSGGNADDTLQRARTLERVRLA